MNDKLQRGNKASMKSTACKKPIHTRRNWLTFANTPSPTHAATMAPKSPDDMMY